MLGQNNITIINIFVGLAMWMDYEFILGAEINSSLALKI
jgi:hypothetical protein